MKINPVGIQSYQQLNRQNQPPAPAPKTEASSAKEAVLIEPQTSLKKSAVAVKGPSGDYAKYLSTEERQALDLLFSKYADSSRFGAAFQADQSVDEGPTVGSLVDVKV
ncbi:MAG: hypothetical protein GY867_00370 [bacterium]|nr:hypothetical protein [bacterium]